MHRIAIRFTGTPGAEQTLAQRGNGLALFPTLSNRR